MQAVVTIKLVFRSLSAKTILLSEKVFHSSTKPQMGLLYFLADLIV